PTTCSPSSWPTTAPASPPPSFLTSSRNSIGAATPVPREWASGLRSVGASSTRTEAGCRPRTVPAAAPWSAFPSPPPPRPMWEGRRTDWLSSLRRERRPQLVRDVPKQSALRRHQAFDALGHAIEVVGQIGELVPAAAHGRAHAHGQIARRHLAGHRS